MNASSTKAFTRWELAAVLASLSLLALLALPALASHRERSARVLCMNNLRQLGQGMAQYQSQHGRLPWALSWCEGGTRTSCAVGGLEPPVWVSAGLHNNVWFQFASFSNELQSPKVLACPEDLQKRPAATWDASANGLFHPNNQNRACSYFVPLDVVGGADADIMLTGDRSIRLGAIASACSSGVAPARSLNRGDTTTEVEDFIHAGGANFFFQNGSVDALSSQGFRRRIFDGTALGRNDDNGNYHYIVP